MSKPSCTVVLLLFFISAATGSASRCAEAQQLLRVPQDRDLQSALDQIADGGLIEISSGTYPSPEAGFRIRFPGKGFTVRAATGAQVSIDGGGFTDILRITDSR